MRSRRRDEPGVAEALRKGDVALKKAGIGRQGGTGIGGIAGGPTTISFGVTTGEREAAEIVLSQAELEVPFEIRERAPIKAQKD